MLKTIQRLKQGENVVIMCLGDSITEQNFHVNGRLNYVGQLGEYLINNYGRKVTILNLGLSGNTTWGLLDRLDMSISRYQPDMATIMLGINDSARGIDKLPEFRNNIELIIKNLTDMNIEFLFLTQNPINYCIYSDDVNLRKSYPYFVEAIREITSRKGIPLCDIHQEWGNYTASNPWLNWPMMNDPIHPNERGHDFIAKTLIDFLEGRA